VRPRLEVIQGGRDGGDAQGGWPERSRPRRAEGGIKARSKRGTIGERWWSRRFIDVLETFGMSGRLARGRSYARSGQVLDFELAPGYVTAHVQGSRARPYRVRIQVLPLTTGQWRTVERALASQALFRARLLAGEMPAEIEDVFAGCGTPLFPRGARDMEMSCSCPDWEVPCKHLAAVCYVLAEAFDDDPFGMLAWRGRSREELLDALRLLTAAETDGPGQDDAPRPVIDVTGSPLADCLDSFWSAGMSPARLRALPAAPRCAAGLLLRTLEPPSVRVRGKNLVALLTPAYQQLAGQAGDEDQISDGLRGRYPDSRHAGRSPASGGPGRRGPGCPREELCPPG
jgi:uncharacterized Zn finger protein